METKIICHLTSVHDRYDTRIFLKECKSIAQAGFEVILIVADGLEREKKNNITIVGIEKPKNRLKRFLFTGWRIYREARRVKADVYHFHDPELIPVGLLLRWKGVSVIYDVHEDVPRDILIRDYIYRPFRKLLAAWVEYIENRACQKYTHIVTATPYIRERFRARTSRVTDINNYPIIRDSITEIPWDKRENALCFVGLITGYRAIFEIVRALEKVDVHLNLVGYFYPESIRAELQKEKGWFKVREYGFIPHQDAIQVVRKSKIGLMISYPKKGLVDSQPIKMYEYMYCSLPVIASNFPLWRKIIEEDQCGICVDPYRVEEIVKAIHFLMNEQEQAARMGRNGKQAVEQKYNWSREETKLLSIYRQILTE